MLSNSDKKTLFQDISSGQSKGILAIVGGKNKAHLWCPAKTIVRKTKSEYGNENERKKEAKKKDK